MSSSDELVFVKLGGSLITDKRVDSTARPRVIARLAGEMARAKASCPSLRLLVGHGSGSFGHVVAKRYQVQTGCTEWRGYAETSHAALRLNRIVTDLLLESGLPVVSIQPSASARAQAGVLLSMDVHPVRSILHRGLVPLVFGDVALDETWGSTIISTESIFSYLAPILHPQRILLVGQVQGVFTGDPNHDSTSTMLSVIHAHQTKALEASLGASHADDVTGGMRTKVEQMARLVSQIPDLRVLIFGGEQKGKLQQALANPEYNPGTLIIP